MDTTSRAGAAPRGRTRKTRRKRSSFSLMFRAKLGSWVWSLFRWGIIIGISYVILYPLFVKISVSFMNKTDMYDMTVRWVPKNFTLDNFRAVIPRMRYWEHLSTTLLYTLWFTFLQTAFTALAGYGLAKFRFRGRNVLYILVLLTLVIPPQTYITASFRQFRYFDFFGIGKIFGMQPISLNNTIWPVTILSIGCMGVKNGLFIYILQQFFRSMPKELDEAAWMDGAGPWKIFLRVALPNAMPAMTTVVVFAFVWNWNDLYSATTYMPSVPLLSTSLSKIVSTIEQSYGGWSFIDAVELSQLTNAGALLILAPILLFFLLAQKFFVQGIERTGLTGL